MYKRQNLGFTLIEMLIVVAMIGVLATVLFIAINPLQQMKKTRDAGRLSDMAQIVRALEWYFVDYGRFPSIDGDSCCDGWDVGPCGGDGFISALETSGNLKKVPQDPEGTGGCTGYAYYRYGAGGYGCDASKGAYYVLGVRDMEATARPHPDSPGWSCPNRNWQNEFDWVVGAFENP